MSPRHLASFIAICLLLGFSWYSLHSWYSQPSFTSWLFFALSFLVAFVIVIAPLVVTFTKLRSKRLLLLAPFLIVALPWAEWLNVTTANLREPWTRQLFLKALCVYAAILFLYGFPEIRNILNRAIHRFVNACFSGKGVYVCPILFFAASSFISIEVFNQTPFLQDSAAHLFQAKIFLAGSLTAPEPQPAHFFSLSGDMLVIHQGRWFSMYQPGFAFLLAGAMLLSSEWLLSPFLGAATIFVWIQYARRWHGIQTAGAFGLIAITSPFLLIMSSTIMVYTPELFFVSVVVFYCRDLLEKENRRGMLCLFGALVFVMVVRAFSSAIFLAPILVYTFVKGLRNRPYKLPLIIFFGLVCGGALLVYYQTNTTGDPFRTGYSLEFPDLKLGFGTTEGSHTPLRGLANVSNNLLGLNAWLTGWFSGALLFVALFLLFSPKIDLWDSLLLTGTVAVVCFYFFHYFQDLILGPRYFYVFAPFLLLLIARSAFIQGKTSISTYVLPLIAISIVVAAVLHLPAAIRQYQIERTYPGNLKRELDRAGSENLLVFLDRTVRPYFVNYNDPFLRGNAIICLDRGAENLNMMRAFPNHRPVYFRTEITMKAQEGMSPGYRFFDKPNENPSGFVSMNHLALAIQNSSAYLDQDFFHIAYSDVLNSGDGPVQLGFVRNRLNRSSTGGKRMYAIHFEQGLLHTAQLLLIPKAAFDSDRLHWKNHVDWKTVRSEFDLAKNSFRRAGEIGKPITPAFDKASNAIDTNHDGSFSDLELSKFFEARLSLSH